MSTQASRENILRKIRKALNTPVPLPFPESENGQPVYPRSDEELAIAFAQEFTKLQGRFAYCLDDRELGGQLQELFTARGWKEVYCVEPILMERLRRAGISTFTEKSLADCDVAITGCEFLVARTGSMVMSAAQASGRTTSVYAPVHICVAFTSQLVYDVKDALFRMREKYKSGLPSLITFATGPSRTADIEKTLVVGVHGPGEAFCFLVEE